MILEPLTLAMAEATARTVIEKASPQIISKISKRLGTEVLRLRVQFTKTFVDHISKSLHKSSTIRTVTSRDKVVSLEEIYVPLTLSCNDQTGLPDLTADPTSSLSKRIVISGTGGAGKTVLVKHLLNKAVNNPLGFIPLFVELRNIEFDNGSTFERCLYISFNQEGIDQSFELFEVALKEGLFALYLDGFDEIHPSESDKALSLIKSFANKFRKCSVLISTRPRTGATRLQDFTVYHVEPLSKDNAVLLIKKTEFDENTKVRFARELETGLYDRHTTLMSLPILVAMMLLAFRTYADIPDRMTVFYGQAFETLYSIHDAENKELYKRQHRAGLAPDVFKSVLQAFCYLSLANYDIEFSEVTLHDYIERALKISNVDAKANDYRDDLINNVCVIQPDGLQYVFVHRSFQEYFAARFALNYSGENKFSVIDQITDVPGSGVARMLCEIDAIKTTRYWLITKLDEIHKQLTLLSKKPLLTQFESFCSTMWIAPAGDEEHEPIAYSIGHGNPKLIRAMEVANEALEDDISYRRIIHPLKMPALSTLKNYASASSAQSFKKNEGCSIAYIEEYFKLTDESGPVIDETDFPAIFNAYRKTISLVLRRLKKDVAEFRKIEDAELFA